MLKSLTAAAVLCLSLLSIDASADVLLIDEVRERMLRDLPSNGMAKTEVEQRWGAPNERHRPVGQPPITRWVYDDYSVFFEGPLVLESVLHHGAVLNNSTAEDAPN